MDGSRFISYIKTKLAWRSKKLSLGSETLGMTSEGLGEMLEGDMQTCMPEIFTHVNDDEQHHLVCADGY